MTLTLLSDRHLAFSDKLYLAIDIIRDHKKHYLLEELADWTFATLLRLSKAPQPRPEIFLSDDLWNYLAALFSTAFPPDSYPLFTCPVHRAQSVSIRQPILPVFAAFFKISSLQAREPSESFLAALKMICRLYCQDVVDLNGKWPNYLELAMLSKQSAGFEASLLILNHFCAANSKKTISSLQSSLPDVLTDEWMKEGEALLEKAYVDPMVHGDETCEQMSRLAGVHVHTVYRLYLQRLEAVDRARAFRVFQRLSAMIKDEQHLPGMIGLLDKHHVYVHRNDEVYSAQRDFIRQMMVDRPSAVVLSAIMSIDFYLVIDHMDLVDAGLLSDGHFQRALFKMAVQARIVDQVIGLLRRLAVRACRSRHEIYLELSRASADLLRHWESLVCNQLDEYWECLALLCKLPSIPERLSGCADMQIRKRVSLYCHSNGGHVHADDLSFENVPLMDEDSFKRLLELAAPEQICDMLKQPQFYEYHRLQPVFEGYLLSRSRAIQSQLIGSIPFDYLTDNAIVQMADTDGMKRIVKKRPSVVRRLFDSLPTECIEVLCRFAVGESDGQYLKKLLPKHLDDVLKCPANGDHADLLLACENVDWRFIPYIMAKGERGLVERVDCPEARHAHPYLYSSPPTSIDHLTHYDGDTQRCFLSSHALAPPAIVRLIADTRTRAAALECIRGMPTVHPTILKAIIPMLKHALDMPHTLHSLMQHIPTALSDVMDCCWLLIQHRAVYTTSPPHVVAFTHLMLALMPALATPLQAHDYGHNLHALLAVKCKTAKEVMMAVVVRYAQLEGLQSAVRLVLDGVMSEAAGWLRRVHGVDNLLAWGPPRLHDIAA